LTPGYAPLEQYGRALKYGAFTDIYALGSTLYYLLTGEAPVSAIERAAGVELKSVKQIAPQISVHVSKAIAQAMAMDITQRIQSVQEFFDLLYLERTESSFQVKPQKFYDSTQDVWGVFGQPTTSKRPKRPANPPPTNWF